MLGQCNTHAAVMLVDASQQWQQERCSGKGTYTSVYQETGISYYTIYGIYTHSSGPLPVPVCRQTSNKPDHVVVSMSMYPVNPEACVSYSSLRIVRSSGLQSCGSSRSLGADRRVPLLARARMPNKTNCNNFTLVTRMNKLHGLWAAMTQKNILSRYVRLEASTATRKYCISEESKAGGSGKSFWRSRAGAMWVPLRESRLEHQAAFLDFVDVQYSTTTAMPSVIIIGAGA